METLNLLLTMAILTGWTLETESRPSPTVQTFWDKSRFNASPSDYLTVEPYASSGNLRQEIWASLSVSTPESEPYWPVWLNPVSNTALPFSYFGPFTIEEYKTVPLILFPGGRLTDVITHSREESYQRWKYSDESGDVYRRRDKVWEMFVDRDHQIVNTNGGAGGSGGGQ